jgi:hypothetical protein
VNALANADVGKFIEENFVSSFQRVATFRIVGKQKQGGNVATYFCAPDGRVLHAIAGPVNAATMQREARWVVDTARNGIEANKKDGTSFKAFMRTAHAAKLRTEHGLVVEPVTFDAPAGDGDGALSYRDPTGRPLAPVLKPAPIDGPDVKFRGMQELSAKGAGGAMVVDRKGARWGLNNQGRVHVLLAAHAMGQIEDLYGSVFEGILGQKITTRPVEVVNPFPWVGRTTVVQPK